MPAPPPLQRRKDGPVLWLTIDRPEVRNALDDEVIVGLTDELLHAPEDPDLRAVVLTATGDRVFCAGADLAPGADVVSSDKGRPAHPYADLLRAGTGCPLPLIARVNGHVLAGGMGLVAMCDIVVAADHARFGLPEVKVGLFPMMAGAILREVLPPRVLSELALTGEPIDAARALEAGLITYTVPADELDDKVAWLLSRITDKSPTGIRHGKRALAATRELPLDAALVRMGEELTALSRTEDAAEGMRAFHEKRPPRWTGR